MDLPAVVLPNQLEGSSRAGPSCRSAAQMNLAEPDPMILQGGHADCDAGVIFPGAVVIAEDAGQQLVHMRFRFRRKDPEAALPVPVTAAGVGTVAPAGIERGSGRQFSL